MKKCPLCNRTYEDESLNFCLQDGAALESVMDGATTFDSEATVIDPKRVRPATPPTEPYLRRPQETEKYSAAPPTEAFNPNFRAPKIDLPQRRNTASVVGLTIAGTVLLLAVGAVAAWFVLRAKPSTPAGLSTNQTENNAASNDARPSPTSDSDKTRVAQGNLRIGTGPSPQTLSPADAAAVKQQVSATLTNWASQASSRNAEGHAAFYGATINPYYKRGSVGVDAVRSDADRAYQTFTSLDIRVSNIEVTPDPDGSHATAVFDKTWNFAGDRTSSGSVQQKLWLEKQNGRWVITGEKDVKIYYLGR